MTTRMAKPIPREANRDRFRQTICAQKLVENGSSSPNENKLSHRWLNASFDCNRDVFVMESEASAASGCLQRLVRRLGQRC